MKPLDYYKKYYHSPRVDLYESIEDNTFHVRIELPGIDEKNIRFYIENNTLIISAFKHSEHNSFKRIYYEAKYGNINRRVKLPKNVNEDYNVYNQYGVYYIIININEPQQSVPQSVQQNHPQSEPQSVQQSEPQSVPQSVQQNHPQSEPQSDPQSVQQNEPQSVQQSDPQSVQQSKPQSEPQSDYEFTQVLLQESEK